MLSAQAINYGRIITVPSLFYIIYIINLCYLVCANDNTLSYSVNFISFHMDDTLSFIVIFISLHFPRKKKTLGVGPPLGLINVRKKARDSSFKVVFVGFIGALNL
jgi:hypothetical protein